ncbi:unnamed protein product [Meloidogyne enterolobii]|uniref:Uncharacterized protein n=1 Tax=Meloidogyne enterolobii TaxID=390850 RepID=A0ACB0YPK9_MELEN
MMPTSDSVPKCSIESSSDNLSPEERPESLKLNSAPFDCCHLAPPTSLLGRTLSASAIDYRGAWRSKNKTHLDGAKNFQERLISSPASSTSCVQQSLKRKLSNSGVIAGSDLPEINVGGENAKMFLPHHTILNQEGFISRPSSPAASIVATSRVPMLTRGRVASIRRESDCSTENEAAHEKLIKTSQQVSLGFEDFCLDDKLFEERKRAKSLTEPISVFTNAFLPQSSTPSPTRNVVDSLQKQCYSPSTQQVVRANISYSPIPSPTTPASPYNRMRSMSPIAVRQVSKRRYTASSGNGFGNQSSGSGLDSDGENNSFVPSNSKRRCTALLRSAISSSSSPLVRESTSNVNLLYYQQQQLERLSSNFDKDSKPVSEVAVSSSIDSNTTDVVKSSSTAESTTPLSRLLVDPQIAIECFQSSSAVSREDEDSSPIAESVLCSSFCSGAGYDANSSTTFSSRANTPHSEMLESSGVENDASLSILLPPQSSSSSDCSSQHSISAVATNQKNLLPTTVNLSSSNEEQIGNEK